MINKCFCTRRNPISISAAAIYLACQLEDKRKTQAEICKITGLTEVTLRKVYKELLENWHDLLPSNYTPAVPPEKAFPTTTIPSTRSSTVRIDPVDIASLDKDKLCETKSNKPNEPPENLGNNNSNAHTAASISNRQQTFRQPWLHFSGRTPGEKHPSVSQGDIVSDAQFNCLDLDHKVDKDEKGGSSSVRVNQATNGSGSSLSSISWPFRPPLSSGQPSSIVQVGNLPKLTPGHLELKGTGGQHGSQRSNPWGDAGGHR